jgi:hypothetical protein
VLLKDIAQAMLKQLQSAGQRDIAIVLCGQPWDRVNQVVDEA